LLLFIRNADVTTVVERAVGVIEAHRCYVRSVPGAGTDLRRDFVLHADGDEQRLLKLAFVPFALRSA
jgi:hypothetical protein